MKYEWDEAKRSKNLVKWGVDFEIVKDFNWDHAQVTEDDRYDYEEQHFIVFSHINQTVYRLVMTFRGEVIRVISLKRATPTERKNYEQ